MAFASRQPCKEVKLTEHKSTHYSILISEKVGAKSCRRIGVRRQRNFQLPGRGLLTSVVVGARSLFFVNRARADSGSRLAELQVAIIRKRALASHDESWLNLTTIERKNLRVTLRKQVAALNRREF